MSEYGLGHKPLDGAHVHVEILDEILVHLFDGHVGKMILVFQEGSEVAVRVRVMVIAGCGTVYAHAQGIVAVVLLKQLHDGVLRFR